MQLSPQVATNAVLFHYVEGQLLVALTTEGGGSPTQKWQLPAANIGLRQTSLQALEHKLYITCGLRDSDVTYREQLYSLEYTRPDRNEVFISYLYLSRELVWHKGSQPIGLFPVDRLPPMSSEDSQTLAYALDRLKAKAVYTTLPGLLLASEFELSSYQQIFEALTGKSVDKRNFRKKLRSLNILKEKTTKKQKNNQPILYSLRSNKLEILSKSF